jgi:hypothetical protein
MNFFQDILKEYRERPYLSPAEAKEWESLLKKNKIKKNQVGLLIDLKYRALNKRQKKKQLPRVLLDFFKLGEKARLFEKFNDLREGIEK